MRGVMRLPVQPEKPVPASLTTPRLTTEGKPGSSCPFQILGWAKDCANVKPIRSIK